MKVTRRQLKRIVERALREDDQQVSPVTRHINRELDVGMNSILSLTLTQYYRLLQKFKITGVLQNDLIPGVSTPPSTGSTGCLWCIAGPHLTGQGIWADPGTRGPEPNQGGNLEGVMHLFKKRMVDPTTETLRWLIDNEYVSKLYRSDFAQKKKSSNRARYPAYLKRSTNPGVLGPSKEKRILGIAKLREKLRLKPNLRWDVFEAAEKMVMSGLEEIK